MEYLIKWLLKFHRGKIEDALVADYFGRIPQKVTDTAVSILSEKRSRVDQWLAFQSFLIQRRMISDPKNAPVLYGMCVQLKLMSHMLSAAAPIAPGTEDLKPASAAEQQRKESEQNLDEALKGVKDFLTKKEEKPAAE